MNIDYKHKPGRTKTYKNTLDILGGALGCGAQPACWVWLGPEQLPGAFHLPLTSTVLVGLAGLRHLDLPKKQGVL